MATQIDHMAADNWQHDLRAEKRNRRAPWKARFVGGPSPMGQSTHVAYSLDLVTRWECQGGQNKWFWMPRGWRHVGASQWGSPGV